MNKYKIFFKFTKRKDYILRKLFFENSIKKFSKNNKIKILKTNLHAYFNSYLIIVCSKDQYYELYKYMVCNQDKLCIKVKSDI